MRLYPAADDLTPSGTGPTWDSPGADDINAALDHVGLGEGAEAPAPAKAETPTPGETPKEEPPTPKTTPKDEPEKEEPEKEAAASEPKKFTIKGVEYTEEELAGHIKGGMFQADYTRKTQDLAREKDEIARYRHDLEARERDLVEQARSLTGSRRTGTEKANELDEMLEDPDVPDSVKRAVALVQAENQAFRDQLEQRERQAQQDRVATDAMQTFEDTFSELCKKHDVTDPVERKLLRADILVEDPDIDDPGELKRSVERIFANTRKGLAQRAEKIRSDAIAEHEKARGAAVSKIAEATPSVGGGATMPAKAEPKPPATLDDDSAAEEFAERLARLRGVAR